MRVGLCRRQCINRQIGGGVYGVRVLWWPEASDVEDVHFAEQGEHTVEGAARMLYVDDAVLIQVQQFLAWELAAEDLAGIVARMLEDVGSTWHIINVEVPPEFVGAALANYVDAFRDAALTLPIVEPWEFEHGALHDRVAILVYSDEDSSGAGW